VEVNKIIRGNTLTVLKTLPNESVNCVVTSPLYWGLRDYGIEPVIWDGDKDCKHIWGSKRKIPKTTQWNTGGVFDPNNRKTVQEESYIGQFCSKCSAWRGSLGLEPTFELYIKHLCDIFDEVKRVLRKDGTCWVNLGDSYASNGGASRHFGYQDPKYKNGRCGNYIEPSAFKQSVLPKSLCLIPQRFAIEMVNRGWILRNTLIWHKPNCMPSSAKDRFTVDFEYIYFFVKSKKYWFEQQFEKSVDPESYTGRRPRYHRTMQDIDKKHDAMGGFKDIIGKKYPNRNKRAVWTIPTHPFPEAHFAVYPEKLIEPMIKAGCPIYVCKKCGKAREKILEKGELISSGPNNMAIKPRGFAQNKLIKQDLPKDPYGDMPRRELKEIGYTTCNCNAGFEGGVVLDPFSGAGTTAVVAKKEGRNYLGIEIKQEYIDIANKRIRRIPELLF